MSGPGRRPGPILWEGRRLNDEQALNVAIAAQKHMAHLYNACAEHASDPQMLQELVSLLGEEQELRLQVYQAMNQRGWYNPQPISQQQLDQAKQSFQQKQQSLRQSLQ